MSLKRCPNGDKWQGSLPKVAKGRQNGDKWQASSQNVTDRQSP